MAWYGVRCVFEWEAGLYEERLTLWNTESLDAAIELAEQEAASYVEDTTSFRYLRLAQAYHIGDDCPGHGDEVYSLLRDSALGPDDYLSAFFDTGTERQS